MRPLFFFFRCATVFVLLAVSIESGWKRVLSVLYGPRFAKPHEKHSNNKQHHVYIQVHNKKTDQK